MPRLGAVGLSEYRLFATDEFARTLERLAEPEGAGVRAKLTRQVYPQLRQMPSFGPHIAKLVGYEPPTWRYRIGRYRLFFQVDEVEKIVFLLTLHLRRDAYR